MLITLTWARAIDSQTAEPLKSTMEVDSDFIVGWRPQPNRKTVMVFVQGAFEWLCWDEDGTLSETLRKAKSPQPNTDIAEAWQIARADGYRGDLLAEFAAYVIITRGMEKKRGDSYMRGFEEWKAKAEALLKEKEPDHAQP